MGIIKQRTPRVVTDAARDAYPRESGRDALGAEFGDERFVVGGPTSAPEQPQQSWSVLSWWYHLTAPPEAPAGADFATKELARRGRLLSVFLLTSFGILAGAFYQFLIVDSDHPVMVGLLVVALVLTLLACGLNRAGWVRSASVLMVLLAEVPLATVPATTGKLDILHLGAFYLLAGSLMVAASLLAPWSSFPLAAINSVGMLATLVIYPHTERFRDLIASNDGQQAFAGPILMQFIVAIVAYLWAQNIISALRRAHAVAALERRELDRQGELEEGVRQLLAVHVRLANGEFNARTPPLRNPLLWQVGNSLNMLVGRLARYAQAESVLRREQEEARRLADAVYTAQSGRPPVWPAPTGLPLDAVTDALRRGTPGQVAPPSRPLTAPGAPSRTTGAPAPRLTGAPAPRTPSRTTGAPKPRRAEEDLNDVLPGWLRQDR